MVCLLFFLSCRVDAACSHEFETVEVPPTCEESGYRGYVCKHCGQGKDFENLDALGHTPGAWQMLDPPGCKSSGTQASSCTTCGGQLTRSVPPLGHDYTATVVPPTCTADGYTRHYCPNCEDAYRTDTVPKTGHIYDDGVITKEPTLTTMGRITYTCIGCGKTRQETTPKWNNPFKDLDKKAYYFDSVLWASNNGITSGVSGDRFQPEGVCTRAQVVTFLWRMAGCPDPAGEGGSFEDVPPDSYFARSVLWAVEQGITHGVSDVRFAPNDACTRAQVVCFLYRYFKPEQSVKPAEFADVDPDAYYAEAVAWASAEGITKGTSADRFSPDDSCTRAQIVVFLNRVRKLDEASPEI